MASPSLPPPHEPLTLAGLAPWLLTVMAGALLWSARVVVGQELQSIRQAINDLSSKIGKIEDQLDEVLEEIHALGKEAAVQAQKITALESRVRQLEADQRNRHSA